MGAFVLLKVVFFLRKVFSRHRSESSGDLSKDKEFSCRVSRRWHLLIKQGMCACVIAHLLS